MPLLHPVTTTTLPEGQRKENKAIKNRRQRKRRRKRRTRKLEKIGMLGAILFFLEVVITFVTFSCESSVYPLEEIEEDRNTNKERGLHPRRGYVCA